MSRYTQPTKGKYVTTDPVYCGFDKDEVDNGIATGDFVLMEQTAHMKVNGRLVGYPIRRYVEADQVERRLKQNWVVVSLSGAELSAAAPAAKRGPGRPPKVQD